MYGNQDIGFNKEMKGECTIAQQSAKGAEERGPVEERVHGHW